jgi:hypothetical protein
MDWDSWERPANWEMSLGPQMKSKKNGTKESLCKWFYFWMKMKQKKRKTL